jgi:alpha-D-ribose 1-methylphosphonate 5-triphosphate synthase subunit PhnG
MNVSVNLEGLPPRADWLGCWSSLPAADIESLAAAITRDADVIDLALPQAGLALLQLRDSALNDPYFLGEIPMARAHVRVCHRTGEEGEGAACLMDDRITLTQALAILDATLANALPGCEAVADALREGDHARQKERRTRKRLLAMTKVDFSLLAPEDDDE